jgi:predicted transcriptional regulator of viral defense system
MLTKDQIRLILARLNEKTVVERSPEFPYRISVETRGYSEDPEIGHLQAKLSIMLEAARS